MDVPVSLEDTIKVSLTPFHLERIRRIDAEDFSDVRKKIARDFAGQGHPVSVGYLDRGILALKQYYAVALLDPNNSHAVSDTVDPFWHAHLLFTERYTAFSKDVVGVFMHHIPLDPENAEQVANVDALYGYTRETLERLFRNVDEEFWPEVLPEDRLICLHKGNQAIYADEVYAHALFPSDTRGVNYAFR